MSNNMNKIYNINDIVDYTMIQLPCYIQKCSTGIDMIGGKEEIMKVSKTQNTM